MRFRRSHRYVAMRVGTVRMIPYVRPGDPSLGDHIRKPAGKHAAVLLANHGPVVSAKDLEERGVRVRGAGRNREAGADAARPRGAPVDD